MKFVFEQSLTDAAKAALVKGTGKHGKFAVDCFDGKRYIASLDNSGRAMDWFLVVKGKGEPIKGIPA